MTNYERIHCKPQNSLMMQRIRSSHRRYSVKKTLAQVFSCAFCEISRNTFSYITPPITASEALIFRLVFLHKDSICSLKFRFLSKLIPKSFSHFLLEVAFFCTDYYFTGVIARQKNFILLLLNQFKSLLHIQNFLLFCRVLCSRHNWPRPYF